RHLGLRRMRGVSIYETPLGTLIPQLVLTFRSRGFHLSAPVYDHFDDAATLRREVRMDVRMGLIGKTAIHPKQAEIIDKALRVSEGELSAAKLVLSARSGDAAVFKHDGAMLEIAVHNEWAHQTIERAAAAGTLQ
ncbi:MAG: HpcH/HpaI aldolase/citrate lyase family protein, partial [Oricola sp.]|nr:HpcH/HpaI aldolase/citrate lyase family protein [Oricola sp.]